MNMNINTLVTLITKLINKPAHDALVTQNKIMDNLTIEEWLPKIPDGTYAIGDNAFLNVFRENGFFMISAQHNYSVDDLPVHLAYDAQGLNHCSLRGDTSTSTFLRKGKYYKASDEANYDINNVEKTKAGVAHITSLIRNIGLQFYHNEPISLI
jgi:hypothetical protein